MTWRAIPYNEGFKIYHTTTASGATLIAYRSFEAACRYEQLWQSSNSDYFIRESRNKTNGTWANWQILPKTKKEARDWILINYRDNSLEWRLLNSNLWEWVFA
jgi:hypothetical protein